MDGYFQHNKAVIDYAYQLVKEYEAHEREQNKVQREKQNDKVE